MGSIYASRQKLNDEEGAGISLLLKYWVSVLSGNIRNALVMTEGYSYLLLIMRKLFILFLVIYWRLKWQPLLAKKMCLR
jgi:hypothetical protein